MADPLSRKYTEKLKQMRERGDKVGIRRLQFGGYVYSLRKIVPQLSQSKAAKLAGMSRSQWARIEAGKHFPRPHQVPAMARAIRGDIDALYRAD